MDAETLMRHRKPLLANTKPKNRYRTAWFFVDHENLDKLMYEIVHRYLTQGRYTRSQELWAKYFATCYLGGFRRVEPFLSKVVIDANEEGGTRYYHLVKTNAKHFRAGRNGQRGDRVRIPLLFTPANRYEAALWEFLAPHNRTILDFTPLLGIEGQLTKRSLANVSKMFSMRFRGDITNGEAREQNGGITPHMLRHARTYDMHIIEGYPDYVVMKIMGWNKRDMIDWYEDIKSALTIHELKEIYRQRTSARLSAPDGGILGGVYIPKPALG